MPNITLHFDETLLADDELMVLDPTANMIDLSDVMGGWPMSGDISGGDMNTYNARLGPTSPLEVEFNGNATHSGVWVGVSAVGKCQTGGDNSGRCGVNQTTGKRFPGWSDVSIEIGSNPFDGATLMANITGIRYAWGSYPCCPGVNRALIGCKPNSCPIQTKNSTLPAGEI